VRRWICPSCRALLLSDRSILLAVILTVLLGGLLVPLVLMEDRTFSVRAIAAMSFYGMFVIVFWVKSIRLARWIRRYEQQVASVPGVEAGEERNGGNVKSCV
jgi:hypothetical protein